MSLVPNARLIGAAVRTLRKPGFVRSVTCTAISAASSTAIAAVTGLIVARELGPMGRGAYAAVTAWYGVFVVVGELGQMAATCFYVAKEPGQARDYVATSRSMTFLTGVIMLGTGLSLVPFLGNDQPELERSYQLAFLACLPACVGISYVAGLQARHLGRWNLIWFAQPTFYLSWVLVLVLTDSVTLVHVLAGFACTLTAQAVAAYAAAARSGLRGGRTRRRLVAPLARYGVSQLAAVTPLTVNTQLDKLVLSQAVPLADLGRYAVAVSLTTLAMPFVAAIGYVAFPRLASSEPVRGGAGRLQLLALLTSAGIATAVLLPLAAMSGWLVPTVFGAQFADSVPLIWMLTPAGIFLACGQVAGDLLRGRNRPLDVAGAQALAAALTVVLLLALLPSIGVAAGAVASTIAYGVALVVMVRRLLRLPDSAVAPHRLSRADDSGEIGSAEHQPRANEGSR